MKWWRRFKRVLVRWLSSDPPEELFQLLREAKRNLEQYDNLYGERLHIEHPGYRSQAAAIVQDMVDRRKISRPANLDSEVRMLALTVERLIRYIDFDLKRRYEW